MVVIGDKGGVYDPILVTKDPSYVKVLTRLSNDLNALKVLFAVEGPKQIPVTLGNTSWVGYDLGDTLVNSFGGVLKIENTLHFQHGQLSTEVPEQSSNCRELKNLVETLEVLYFKGRLTNCELFY